MGAFFYIRFEMKKLEIGSKIPKFTLKNQIGVDIHTANFIGKKNLVIYFYPKDDTPGCTKEACAFQDKYEEFAEMGAEVIGISADSVASHKNFAEKYNLSFTLLSDIDNQVRKKFGVPSDIFGLIPGRVTYIIDKRGIIQHIFNAQFNANKHIRAALKSLNEIQEKYF